MSLTKAQIARLIAVLFDDDVFYGRKVPVHADATDDVSQLAERIRATIAAADASVGPLPRRSR